MVGKYCSAQYYIANYLPVLNCYYNIGKKRGECYPTRKLNRTRPIRRNYSFWHRLQEKIGLPITVKQNVEIQTSHSNWMYIVCWKWSTKKQDNSFLSFLMKGGSFVMFLRSKFWHSKSTLFSFIQNIIFPRLKEQSIIA